MLSVVVPVTEYLFVRVYKRSLCCVDDMTRSQNVTHLEAQEKIEY